MKSMKKNLLYLFTLLCTLSFFTACGDDDKDDPIPPVDETWKELSGTYDASSKLIATLNGTDLVVGNGRTVVVAATSAEAATFTLNNVVPDSKTVTINATLAKSNDQYSFTGEQAVGNATISVSGTFDKGMLTIATTRKVASELTGALKLNYITMQAMPVQIGDVYINFQSVDPATNAMVNTQLPMLVGHKLAAKVSEVAVSLKEDGTFDVNWTKVGETTPTGMPAAIAAMVKIQYVVTDGQLKLALDKNLLENPLLGGMIAQVLSTYGVTLEQLIAMLEDLGGYYAFPIKYTITDDTILFYVDKAFIQGAMTAFGPILTPLIPAEYAPMVQGIMALLPTAEKAEVGLRFTK